MPPSAISSERAAFSVSELASSAPPLEILDRTRTRGGAAEPLHYFSGRGNPDELRDEFQAFADAGATSFVVNFWGDTPAEFLEAARIFAKEIMPAFAP